MLGPQPDLVLHPPKSMEKHSTAPVCPASDIGSALSLHIHISGYEWGAGRSNFRTGHTGSSSASEKGRAVWEPHLQAMLGLTFSNSFISPLEKFQGRKKLRCLTGPT